MGMVEYTRLCNRCLDSDTAVELYETGLKQLFTDSTNRVFELTEGDCEKCGKGQSFVRVE
jgi:hypothetical protein